MVYPGFDEPYARHIGCENLMDLGEAPTIQLIGPGWAKDGYVGIDPGKAEK